MFMIPLYFMDSPSYMDELEEVENLQRYYFDMKGPDKTAFLEEQNYYLELIEKLKNDSSVDEIRRQYQDMLDIIAEKKKECEIKEEKNRKLIDEFEKAKKELDDFKILKNVEQKKYEKEIFSVGCQIQEEVLRNIERRNYLQKLKILKFENRNKRNKAN